MTTSLWLSLTDLGRIYGISAVHCGRLLSDAGLRQENSAPSCTALKQGLAYQHHPSTSSYNTPVRTASLFRFSDASPLCVHRRVLARGCRSFPAIFLSASAGGGERR